MYSDVNGNGALIANAQGVDWMQIERDTIAGLISITACRYPN